MPADGIPNADDLIAVDDVDATEHIHDAARMIRDDSHSIAKAEGIDSSSVENAVLFISAFEHDVVGKHSRGRRNKP